MGFIEDVNLEAVAGRAVARGIAQFANLIDATVGGRVDLDYVHAVSGADFQARIALATGFRYRNIAGAAIQRHGQDARHSSLADPAMPAEDVTVGNTLLLDGILQGAGNVFLANHIAKALRTVLARQNLITHGNSIIRYEFPPEFCLGNRARALAPLAKS